MHVFVGAALRYSPSWVMQIIKGITARERSKQFSEAKKQLWVSEFWSDGGCIGTVVHGVMSDVIRNCVDAQGTSE